MKCSLVLFSLAALAGCATPAARESSLAGTRWTVTAIDGQAPAVPDRARLTFQDARLSASVGCNGLGGDYHVEGGRLLVGPVMSTQMYCEGVMEQERAVGALLAGAPEIARQGGTLRLVSGGHSLEARAAER